MASYNLMKYESRVQYRLDAEAELAAVKDGTWPRDLNDEMRWIKGNERETPAEYAGRMCQESIDYIVDLENRIARGAGPDGFEAAK